MSWKKNGLKWQFAANFLLAVTKLFASLSNRSQLKL